MKRTVLTLFSMLIACSLFAQKNAIPLSGAAMAYIFDRKFSEGYTPSENEAALDCTWLPAINLTVLGVNAGGKHVWGLAELNLGSDAIFRAGIGVQF